MQPSMPTPATKEDTNPKVLILGEWRKVLGSFPKDASRRLELDQQFIDELTNEEVVGVREGCQLITSRGAKPKSSGMKTDLIYKRAFCNYL